MSSAETKQQPQFITGTPENRVPKTIQKVAGVDSFLIQYVDHEGRDQVRLAFRVPNTDTCFLMQEKINGILVSTRASRWFSDQAIKLMDAGTGADEVQSV